MHKSSFKTYEQYSFILFLFWIRIWKMRFWDLHADQQAGLWTFLKHRTSDWAMKIKPSLSCTLFCKARLENQHFSVPLPPPHFKELYLLTFLEQICNSVSVANLGQLCEMLCVCFCFICQQNHLLRAVCSLCQYCRIGTIPGTGQWNMFRHGKAGVSGHYVHW